MKLLIAGSRSIKDFDLNPYMPEKVDFIISGGANGIDEIAEKHADKKRISKIIMRPAYNQYGKGAPLKRNEQMVDMCDEVLIIWDGKSKGTKYTEEYAKAHGKKVTTVLCEIQCEHSSK